MFERRQRSPSYREHLNLLSDEQRIALFDLHASGYDLAFVRTTEYGGIAVLTLDGQTAVIDPFGSVDMDPDIKMR